MWKIALVSVHLPIVEEKLVCFVKRRMHNRNVKTYDVMIPWKNDYIITSENNIIKFL